MGKSTDQSCDFLVIGGGIIGSSAALHLARGGMSVAICDRGPICREASGRNAGTLTLMYTRAALMPIARGSWEMWRDAETWLGRDAGFVQKAGLEVAFNQSDAEDMHEEMQKRAEAGAPIRFVSGDEARRIDPAISPDAVLAAYCPVDGYADSNRIGERMTTSLFAGNPAMSIERKGGTFHCVLADGTAIEARRLLISSGAWSGLVAAKLGIDLPMICRMNQGTITERAPPLLNCILRSFREISIKQFANGTILLGGGTVAHWISNPENARREVSHERVIGKMISAIRCGLKAVPALAGLRVVRSWNGYEGFTADNLPIIGEAEVEGVYVACCVRSGFTMGPYIGKLFAETLLGRPVPIDIFDERFTPRRLKGTGTPQGDGIVDQLA
jgi:glycine/D-amino acid oxidase-like deaminating enzyme